MTPQEALAVLDNLRRAVVTVRTEQGVMPLSGQDHDVLRQAVETIRAEVSIRPEPGGRERKK